MDEFDLDALEARIFKNFGNKLVLVDGQNLVLHACAWSPFKFVNDNLAEFQFHIALLCVG